jgi:hypothetical protein
MVCSSIDDDRRRRDPLKAGVLAAVAATVPAAAAARAPDTDAGSGVKSSDGERQRRAIEAAIWGMPIVAMDAMRQAFLRDADASYNDIVYWSRQADWKFQMTTPNASSWYVYIAINTKDGPVVLDIPPAEGAGLFGSMNDAWQIPRADVGPRGLDAGMGGKYLLLPPGYDDAVPSGYLPVPFDTYNGYSILRAIPVTTSGPDVAKALELVRKTRMYPLAKAGSPPPQRYIDMAGKLFDGIQRFDDTFYDSLARMVSEEPVQPHDLVAMGQLRSIGIEKGQSFEPDAEMREVLRQSAKAAQASFIRSNAALPPYYPDGQWSLLIGDFGPETGFTFRNGETFALDERGAFYFLGCAPPVMGGASFYLLGQRDATATPLDGSRTYRLHVPAKVPAQQFWAVTVYDLDLSNFPRQSPKVEVNSYQNLQSNPDGSVDVFFATEAPSGKETNWVYTSPGSPWFAAFRFYAPGPTVFDKSWQLPDIELVA